MNEIDKKIAEALSEEDRDLMKHFDEQGLFSLWFSIYQGRQAWIGILSTIAIISMLVLAGFCLWQFFGAENNVQATKWGVTGGFFMLMVAFMKVWFWIRMEANRVIREIKRLELQLVRMSVK